MPIYHLALPGSLTSDNFDEGPQNWLQSIDCYRFVAEADETHQISKNIQYHEAFAWELFRISMHGANGINSTAVNQSASASSQFSSRHSTFAMKTCCQHFHFTNRQFSTAPYIYRTDIINWSMKRVSRSIFSVPAGPIRRQNSTSTSSKFCCVDSHQRNRHVFPIQTALSPPHTSIWWIQIIQSAVGMIFKSTNQLQLPLVQTSQNLPRANHWRGMRAPEHVVEAYPTSQNKSYTHWRPSKTLW